MISCSSSGNESAEEVKAQSSDEFISYKLNEGVPKARWSDIIDEIKITRLEETDESLLSYVRDIHFSGENMVFVSGEESNVYTFSANGEMLSKMNRKGEGPEEYFSIQDFWLEGDTIAIYSRGKSIKRYTLDGDFISTTEMKYQAGHMLPYTGGYALDMFFATVDDSLFCNVLTLGKNLERGELLMQSKRPEGFNVFTSNNTLAKYKEAFLYQRVMSDTVYLYANSQMKPLIHFDFGQEWFFRGKDEISNGDFNSMFSSSLFWNQSSRVSPEFAYVFGWRGEGNQRKFIVDRIANKIIEITDTNVEEEKYGITISHWVDNGVMGSMNSLELANLLNELEDDQWSFTEGTTLDIIESSENPVIVRVKFKDSSAW